MEKEKEYILLNKKYSSKEYTIIIENDPNSLLQWFKVVKRRGA